MPRQRVTRFDDLLLDALTVIRAMLVRKIGWDDADPEEKGRALELERGLAGELRYARKEGNEALVLRLEALKRSAGARLRMLEGRTLPGDEDLALSFEEDAEAYAKAAPQAEPE